MAIFKIKNITNTLGKRELNYNKTLEIEFVDGMRKRKMLLQPNMESYLKVDKLPISVHKLRISGHVTVTEITEMEFNSILSKTKENIEKNSAEKKKPAPKKTATKSKTATKTVTTKKQSAKDDAESDVESDGVKDDSKDAENKD